VACATATAPGPSVWTGSSAVSAPGSHTPSTPTLGACARRFFAAGCSIPSRQPTSVMVPVAASGSLTVPLSPRPARRFLEQQIEEPALGQPQQEQSRQPEQQQRVPCGQHALEPEPARSRTRRECGRASRDGHDESRAASVLIASAVTDAGLSVARRSALSGDHPAGR
jgi:hypothetical protein